MALPNSNSLKQLKKGELLFREGEAWGSMFLIMKGQVRIFKKKGEQQIEIDTLRPGMILGEMSFLDQQARSASAEAIIDSELVEITQTIYNNTFQNIPEWVKVLLKAVVSRLRATTVKVKNLESASTEVEYTEKGTKRSYVFLSAHDRLKIAMAVLLVASRGKKAEEKETRLSMLSLERYGNQILNIHLSKITTFLEGLKTAEIIRFSEDSTVMFLTNELDLEAYIHFVCDENLLAPEKRHDLTQKGFMVFDATARHLDRFPKNETTGLTSVNMIEVLKLEMELTGKVAFRLDEFEELVKLGYSTQLSAVSATEQTTLVNADFFKYSHKVQKIVRIFEALNEDKEKFGKVA